MSDSENQMPHGITVIGLPPGWEPATLNNKEQVNITIVNNTSGAIDFDASSTGNPTHGVLTVPDNALTVGAGATSGTINCVGHNDSGSGPQGSVHYTISNTQSLVMSFNIPDGGPIPNFNAMIQGTNGGTGTGLKAEVLYTQDIANPCDPDTTYNAFNLAATVTLSPISSSDILPGAINSPPDICSQSVYQPAFCIYVINQTNVGSPVLQGILTLNSTGDTDNYGPQIQSCVGVYAGSGPGEVAVQGFGPNAAINIAYNLPNGDLLTIVLADVLDSGQSLSDLKVTTSNPQNYIALLGVAGNIATITVSQAG